MNENKILTFFCLYLTLAFQIPASLNQLVHAQQVGEPSLCRRPFGGRGRKKRRGRGQQVGEPSLCRGRGRKKRRGRGRKKGKRTGELSL